MFAPCCNFYCCKFGIRSLDPGCNLAGNFYIYFGCLSSVYIFLNIKILENSIILCSNVCTESLYIFILDTCLL